MDRFATLWSARFGFGFNWRGIRQRWQLVGTMKRTPYHVVPGCSHTRKLLCCRGMSLGLVKNSAHVRDKQPSSNQRQPTHPFDHCCWNLLVGAYVCSYLILNILIRSLPPTLPFYQAMSASMDTPLMDTTHPSPTQLTHQPTNPTVVQAKDSLRHPLCHRATPPNLRPSTCCRFRHQRRFERRGVWIIVGSNNDR